MNRNQDSDLGLDGVPVAIGSGSRASLSAVPSTAAADGTRSMPRRVSRARAAANIWGRAIAGFWDIDEAHGMFLVILSLSGVVAFGLMTPLTYKDGGPWRWMLFGLAFSVGAMAPHALKAFVALVRAHSRAVDREVERLSKGGGA